MTDSPTVINELERVHKELAYWRGKAFLLTPYARTQFDSIKNGYRAEFRVTNISPDPEDKQVYKLDNQPDKLVLTKIGLQLLDHLADIKWVRTWNALDSKIDPIDPLFCKVGAEGKVQDLDGAYRNSICTVTLDLREGSNTSKKMLAASTDGKQLARARLNILSQTETLAKNKVRRELLGLQGTYTRKELAEKPFVILKLTPVVDMNDPLVRKLTIMQQFNISSELYDQVVKDIPAVDPVPVIDIRSDLVPPQISEATKSLSIGLVEEVKQLYDLKVRGGRSKSKPPLESLTEQELLEIKSLLFNRPNI
jgi:hypothetical protein